MEQESNFNLESDTNDGVEMMDEEEQFNVTSDATNASSDPLPSVAFAGLDNLESDAETSSTLILSRLINSEEFTNESVSERVKTFQLHKSEEVKHLEEDFIDIDNLQNCQETNSTSSGSFKQIDTTADESKTYNQPLNPLKRDDAAVLSHIDGSKVIQTTHNVQHMDTHESQEPGLKPSEKYFKEGPNGKPETIVDSKNFEKTDNNLEIKMDESLQKLNTEAGTSTNWEDDIDFLGEKSSDGDNQNNNVENVPLLADDTTHSILSDENRISKPGELDYSLFAVEAVDKGDKIESLLVNCESGFEKSVTFVPESDTHGVSEPMEVVDEMMMEGGNVVEEASKNEHEQTHFKSLECENDDEECVTHVNNEKILLDKFGEKDILPVLGVCNNFVKESISSANVNAMIASNIGAQESDIVPHEKAGAEICNVNKEQILQVTHVNSDDVSPEVIESHSLNDITSKVSSFNSTMSKGISSSEISRQTDVAIDAANKTNDGMSILKSSKEIIEPQSVSFLENPDSSVELACANMPQSCFQKNSDLLIKDAVTSNAVLKEADITQKMSQNPHKTNIFEQADGTAPDKSLSHNPECNLETRTNEAVTTCNDDSYSGENVLLTDNGSLSKDTSPSEETGISYLNDESGPDSVEILDIKSELCDLNSLADDPSALDKNVSTTEIKLELNTKQTDDSEEDVMIIDDEGEFVQLKKEILEPKTSENGQILHIPVISDPQQIRHGSTEDSCDASFNEENKSGSSGSKSAKSKKQYCVVCKKMTRCKYNIVRNGDIKHLCDDACFREFRKRPSSFLKLKSSLQVTKSSSGDKGSALPLKDAQAVSSMEGALHRNIQLNTCSVCQLTNSSTLQPFCNWKGLDFCGETCLEKFQGNLNTSCSFCHTFIAKDARTAFCLKIGNDMHPFCKQKCYSEFQKKLKLCSFCQRDVARVPGTFSAMVGTDRKFKEFCSRECMNKMERQRSDIEILSAAKANLKHETITCSVCEKQGPIKFTVNLKDRVNKLCSDLCLSAFQYTNKIDVVKCDYCFVTCTTEEAQTHFVQFEGKVKHFCGDNCVSQFRNANSKVMPCEWCNIQKLNFDMIERLDSEKRSKMFCSLSCLSLFRVHLQAKSNQSVACGQCQKIVPAQYHLTMSDASVLNFCSYTCVMTFQTKFTVKSVSPGNISTQTSSPALPAQTQQQVTAAQQTTGSSRGGGRMTTRQVSKQQTPTFPVISNVVSLAPSAGDPLAQSFQDQLSAPAQMVNSLDAATTSGMVSSGDGKHQIIIQAAVPKFGKNKSLQCRPLTQTKATSCRPHSQNKEVQTDEVISHPTFIPIPVPVYIPMPTVMFSAPAPKLIPFPIPIPVPVFIPTTRKSVSGICKTIQDIVERIPADPLEAELLMMAEAVAADKVSEDEDSEADIEDFGIPVENEDVSPTLKPDEASATRKRVGHGDEDMLQMALRVAEEMSGPIEDLETSVQLVAVSADPPSQQQKTVQSNRSPDKEDADTDYNPPQSLRGRSKRSTRSRALSSRHKRQRLDESLNGEEDSMQSETTSQIQLTEPAPDANYHLKYTYGLNAWRHWVVGKNMQIEKTNSSGSFRARPFPTDILKSTMDELNITLCMFVKEVRKPGGQEYSPDSIYYLCLGLQQYLYEKGRIDSVFTDLYFEKFTEKLHEILNNFVMKENLRGQLLCRIEEEHLWESKQLGAHSPFVLLNTLVYFHTKHFILKTVDEHMALSFAQILKHWKKGMVPLKGQSPASIKNVSLRFYCMVNGKKDSMSARKNKEGVPVYEVTENIDNPLRCPVKLYEFFLSKCPESIKNRNDIFYPIPERSCVPDSPVWYSTLSIDKHSMNKMLTRILLVREIQEAILHAQPIYL